MSSSSGSKTAKAGVFSRLFKRKTAAAAPEAAATAAGIPVTAVGEGEAGPAKTPRKLMRMALMVAFPLVVVGLGAGGYVMFFRPFSASAHETGADPAGPPPLGPVASAQPTEDLRPADYQIVQIFGDEAYLMSANQLRRVKVGSELPGLGRILSIEGSNGGGTVAAANATLKIVAQ